MSQDFISTMVVQWDNGCARIRRRLRSDTRIPGISPANHDFTLTVHHLGPVAIAIAYDETYGCLLISHHRAMDSSLPQGSPTSFRYFYHAHKVQTPIATLPIKTRAPDLSSTTMLPVSESDAPPPSHHTDLDDHHGPGTPPIHLPFPLIRVNSPSQLHRARWKSLASRMDREQERGFGLELRSCGGRAWRLGGETKGWAG